MLSQLQHSLRPKCWFGAFILNNAMPSPSVTISVMPTSCSRRWSGITQKVEQRDSQYQFGRRYWSKDKVLISMCVWTNQKWKTKPYSARFNSPDTRVQLCTAALLFASRMKRMAICGATWTLSSQGESRLLNGFTSYHPFFLTALQWKRWKIHLD